MKNNFVTKDFSPLLAAELKQSIQSVTDYGSVEVYIQKGVVTQISVRHIKKTISTPNGENLRT